MGETSKKSNEIDALAKIYGEFLSRQSDRDFPKFRFNRGIKKGKLMGKEFSSVLTLILLVIKSGQGQQLLQLRSNMWKQEEVVSDWIMLLETLLQWESWLKLPEMKRNHVHLAKEKHQYIMYLIKKVARRTKGMGLKKVKFHAISHIARDIQYFGVPREANTEKNEEHHKEIKNEAKLTQKKKETFDEQTAQRMDEMHCLGLAIEEMEGRKLWNYFLGFDHEEKAAPKVASPTVGGEKFKWKESTRGGEQVNKLVPADKRPRKKRKMMLEQPFIDFFSGLHEQVEDHIQDLHLLTKHVRNGQIFHGAANFRGSVWRDWVVVDWGSHGKLPCKIWGFVDLRDLPHNSGIDYGGLANIEAGIYAIVECSEALVYKEAHKKHIVADFKIEVGSMSAVGGFVDDLKFYLANVEAFLEPAIVVPDVGGPKNGYFWIAARSTWPEYFTSWLDFVPPEGQEEVITDNEYEYEDGAGEVDANIEEEEESEDEESEDGEESEDDEESEDEISVVDQRRGKRKRG